TVMPATGFTFSNGVAVIGTDPLGGTDALTAPPFQYSLNVPTLIRPGLYYLTAIGADGHAVVFSSSISIDVERSDFPTQLGVEPTQIFFESQGEQLPLRIVGSFAD